jgi:hypothetical protein
MLGYSLLLGWLVIEFVLTDLLDPRYNSDRTIRFIPGLDLTWKGKGEELVVVLTLSWLNLELAIMFFDIDYYCDVLEKSLSEEEKQKLQELIDQNEDEES